MFVDGSASRSYKMFMYYGKGRTDELLYYERSVMIVNDSLVLRPFVLASA